MRERVPGAATSRWASGSCARSHCTTACVEVLAAQDRVAAGRLDLEHARLDLEDRDVEGAAAQVEHQRLALELRGQPVGHRRRGRLVHDPQDVEPGDLRRLLGRGALVVVEVGGHGDDALVHRPAEVGLGVELQLAEHHRRDLGQRQDPPRDPRADLTVRPLDQRDRARATRASCTSIGLQRRPMKRLVAAATSRGARDGQQPRLLPDDPDTLGAEAHQRGGERSVRRGWGARAACHSPPWPRRWWRCRGRCPPPVRASERNGSVPRASVGGSKGAHGRCERPGPGATRPAVMVNVSVARRYARALLEASAPGAVVGIAEQLDALADLVTSNPELAEVIRESRLLPRTAARGARRADPAAQARITDAAQLPPPAGGPAPAGDAPRHRPPLPRHGGREGRPRPGNRGERRPAGPGVHPAARADPVPGAAEAGGARHPRGPRGPRRREHPGRARWCSTARCAPSSTT